MKAILVVLIVFSVHSILALKCPTCRGTSCKSDNVPMEECNFRNPFPLIASIKTAVFQADSNYACLDLKHIKDGEVEEISQCIVTNPGYDVCKQLIKENEGVTSCTVKKPQLLEVSSSTESSPASSSTESSPASSSTESSPASSSTQSSPASSSTDSSPASSSTDSSPASSSTDSSPASSSTDSSPASSSTDSSPASSSTGSSSDPSSTSSQTTNPTTPDGKDGATVNQMSLALVLLTVLYGWCV